MPTFLLLGFVALTSGVGHTTYSIPLLAVLKDVIVHILVLPSTVLVCYGGVVNSW